MENTGKIRLKCLNAEGNIRYHAEVDESGELKPDGFTVIRTVDSKGRLIGVRSFDGKGVMVLDYKQYSSASPFLLDSVSGTKRKASSIFLLAGYEIV